ncbi:MFS transporter [Amycolatopsis jiangsuensis]|uniref:MFS family permease n=1 Tax=Amycolatopsis jiangsuensis TaxID=1181879 RepID=A0A840J4R3_9PSEU|nr:MFS transporter [Amycolatopsis jiangsuensis]MBB4688412.1 MFS family permease [Amycolatopsis jiangsuensis]
MPRLSPAYRKLWWATGISTVGDGAFTAAVPLLAAARTDDPRLVSAVAAAASLPWLLLTLPAGQWADRRDRAGLMGRAQVVQAVVAAAVALACGYAGVAVLALTAFALGAGDVVFGTAAQAFLPAIVPKPLLHRANGALQTATVVGVQFAGPPLGSALFAAAPPLPFGVDAVSFAASAALLFSLSRQREPRAPSRAPIGEGVRWLARHRLLRTLALVVGVNTFCGQLATATLVLLATRALHVSPAAYGLLLAAAAVGALAGGLLNARVVRLLGERRALAGTLAANALVFTALGFSPNPFVLGALLAANGFVTTLWNVITVSQRQELVPAPLLGRVTSVYRLLGRGLVPFGALAGGLVAETFGLRAPYPVAGVLRVIALLAALPVLRQSGRR